MVGVYSSTSLFSRVVERKTRARPGFGQSQDGKVLSGSEVEEARGPETLRTAALEIEANGSQPVVAKEDLAKPFAPLKIPLFRSFWIAGLISNLGTWMHETGAQWLMTSLVPSPEMVSAVRTSMTIPIFFLALPAGVWADRFDRRKWLLGTQTVLLLIATLIAALAYMQWMSPWLLLVLTAAMGIGMILNQPAWQSLTPELVPPALVPSAVSVGSISFNLARSLGPLLAGFLVAVVGIWCPFVFNAVSFLAVIVVLLSWRESASESETKEKAQPRARSKPRFWDELRKGLFVVRNSKELRNVLLRVFMFAMPASILWSLLPLVATEKLGFKELGFGFCFGVIGAGAVAGAVVLPYLRTKLSSELIVLAAQLLFAALIMLIGATTSAVVIVPALTLIGTCWMASMTTFNATAQVYLPRTFRARGMSAFMMSFALAIALGSQIWGWLAYGTSLSWAYIAAGCLMVLACIAAHPLQIGSLQLAEN